MGWPETEVPETEVIDCDVLIGGGGMAGRGAAYAAAFWAEEQGLRAVAVEKAAMERGGAVAMGLSAIICYGHAIGREYARGLRPLRPRGRVAGYDSRRIL